jgi:DNA-binding SARP family transcriptional activator
VVADLVWGDHRPSDVTQTLRVTAHRIRQALGEGGVGAAHRMDYVLAVPSSQTDCGRFSALIEAGVEELGHGEVEAAGDSFESALSMWRG